MQQTIKTRSGRVLVLPAEEEDAAINAAALGDPDNPPLTAEQLAQFKRKPGRQEAARNLCRFVWILRYWSHSALPAQGGRPESTRF